MLQQASDGYLGKLRVHQSGRVTMLVGGLQFDVTPGLDVMCHQHAMVFQPNTKQCSIMGNVHRRMVVTPDVNALLSNMHVKKQI